MRERVSRKSLSVNKPGVTLREEGCDGGTLCQNVEGIGFLRLGP